MMMMEPEGDTGILVKLLLIIGIIRGLYRIVLDTPKVWETLCSGWNAFNGWNTFKRWLVSLDGYRPWDVVPAVVRVNTSIAPRTGTLCISVVDTLSGGIGAEVTVQRSSGGRFFELA